MAKRSSRASSSKPRTPFPEAAPAPALSLVEPIAGADLGDDEAAGDAAHTFTLPVTTDRAIAWGAMTNLKTERLERIAGDPEFQRRFGLAPAAAAAPATQLDAATVGLLYDGLGSVCVLAARMKGYHPAAAEVLRWAAEEKAPFLEATAKIAAKYGGDFKYADELLLAVGIVSVIGAKLQLLNAAEEKIRNSAAA